MSRWEILVGDCIESMQAMPETSVDAVVCDPPYGIGFMGHDWDQPGEYGPVRANGHRDPATSDGHAYERQAHSRRNTQGVGGKREGARFGGPTGADNTTHRERGGAMHAGRYDLSLTANGRFQSWCHAWAVEALRVLKPGGHLLAFGGTRTSHRLVSGIEDAGFEIRDSLIWLYGSGFPKSLNVENQGTALKPAHEPICMARKPLVGTVVRNFREHGTGALNIDGCRIGVNDEDYARNQSGDRGHAGTRSIEDRGATDLRIGGGSLAAGRWPANVILDPDAAGMLDEQAGTRVSGSYNGQRKSDKFRTAYGSFTGTEAAEGIYPGSTGGASRFFYCAKTSSAERNAGCDHLADAAKPTWSAGEANPGTFQSDGTRPTARNTHPTVKPIALMRWLCKLVTPIGGLILDPFAGSGTTGCAAVLEGFDFIGLEREPEYVEIARARIAHWLKHKPAEQLGLDSLVA